MRRTLVLSLAVLPLLAATALADRAPAPRTLSRTEVAARCAELGAAGRVWGLDGAGGAFGCQNTTSGQALNCTAEGQCSDYAGDPRWTRIHTLVDKYRKAPRQQPI